MLAPPELLISCSSSLLARVFTLIKSGIENDLSPSLVPCATFAVAPTKTCGSLSRRGRGVSLAPSVSKGVVYRAHPPSLASDFVVTGSGSNSVVLEY